MVSFGSRTKHVAHVNNKGGTRSPQLVNLTLDLWQIYLQRAILISAEHLPGKTLRSGRHRITRRLRCQRMANRFTGNSAFHQKCNVDLVASQHTPAGNQNQALLTQTPERLRLSPVQPTCSNAEEGISGQSRSGPSQSSSQESFYDPKLQTPSEGCCFPLKIHPKYPRLPLAVFHISGISNKLNDFQKTLRSRNTSLSHSRLRA